MMSGLLACILLLASSYLSVVVGQQTSEAPSQIDSRLNGVKYVGPLNNVAGYRSSNDKDEKFECYRCNRYKGGGSPCPETIRQIPGNNVADDAPPAEMIVTGCEVCLKVKTVMAFRNKDFIADKLWSVLGNGRHFEDMQVISRTCIEDKKDARLVSGCLTDTAAGGTVERCYCQGDRCNSSVKTLSSLHVVILLALSSVLYKRLLY